MTPPLSPLSTGIKFVSVFQAYLVVIGTVTSSVYFQEYADFAVWHWVVFGVGLTLITWGVVVVSCARGIRRAIEKREVRHEQREAERETEREGTYLLSMLPHTYPRLSTALLTSFWSGYDI